MSIVRTWAVALTGIDGAVIEVEADLSSNTPAFELIGLADRALGEAVRRVTNACANQGLTLPRRRLTINLSPAALPKRGAGFDVAVAIAAVATELAMDKASLERTAHIGELGLDGRLRPVPGTLPAVMAAARAGLTRIVVPWASREEAELVAGIDVIGAASLAEVVRAHGGDIEVPDCEPHPAGGEVEEEPVPADLADVVGQRGAVEALIVAAAGGHHLLMSGPPGAGKTMLAARLPGILPPLRPEQAMDVASVRSLCGEHISALPRTAPFEAPHHSATIPALVGGGSGVIRPGAIARACHGVLFLDEAGEYSSVVLDSLRQPLESGTITIHRTGVAATFPARFQLILATNPCPCGNYGVRGAECSCPPSAIRRYLSRLSGPLLDRVDIELPMTRVTSAGSADVVSTADARVRVATARERAAERWGPTGWMVNAEVAGPYLRGSAHRLDADVIAPLDRALHRGVVTLRTYDRVLRIAWTLADLDGARQPSLAHVGRALTLKKGVAL